MKCSLFGKSIVLVILFALISTTGIYAEDTVTVVGEIVDDYQIVTSDGKVYEIGNTEKGTELLDTITNEKVSVKGILHQEGDTLVIDVISYEVVAE